MPLITTTNYNDVPLVLPPIEPGVYDLEVTETSIEENSKKTGQNLVVKAKVSNEGPFKGRSLTQYFALTPRNDFSEVNLKRLFASAQVPIEPDGGLDSDKLLQKLVKVTVGSRTFTDKQGKQQEGSDVSKILIPQENWT